MSTSGTYNFGSTISEQFIIDAYERCGILPDVITAEQIQSGQRSINLLLSEWINKGLNLWTVKQSMLNLIPNQNAYLLPYPTSDVLEATIRTSNRNLGGTAFSSAGGIAQNAFDNNPATACTQTAPNGYISYNWGTNVQYAINMVGIQSNVTTTYTPVCEYSNDGINWFQVLAIPAQTFTIGINVWFVVPVPTLGQYFRVRETGGATLNIQELYFNTSLQDTVVTRISRAEYISYPLKNQTGRPTSFYVDRQINPVIYLWPTPTPQYNNLFYTRVELMQDIGQMINMADIPQRFYEALVSGLAVKLSIKYMPARLEILRQEYEHAFNIAAREDTERVPLRIYGDYQQGWTRT
jgi:hypothetical protein